MKRFIALILTFVLFFFVGCNTAQTSGKDIVCTDVIAAYEGAGFEVWHNETTTEQYPWVCRVKAENLENGDYIYFHFFASHEQAVEYYDERKYNVLIWMFSVIFGEPSWLTVKVYNNIEIEFDKSYLYKPFKTLL